MGQWNNQDGLPLLFGTTKALPDWSGDYVMYGSTREFECLIPLVPVTMGGYTVPAIPTSFSGTTTYAAAGISNPDLLVPLQTTAVQTASGSALTVSKPQLYIGWHKLLSWFGCYESREPTVCSSYTQRKCTTSAGCCCS